MISIPYGAIKSRNIIEKNTYQLNISIPYGAIKRLYPLHQCLSALQFQFLMVRLKEKIKSITDVNAIISIPYGAIKSNRLQTDNDINL